MTGQEIHLMPETAAFVSDFQRAANAATKAISAFGRVFNVVALTWPQESRVESARRRRVDRMMRTRDRRKARRVRRTVPS